MQSLKYSSLILFFSLLFSSTIQSQIVSGESFMKANYVEIGVNQYGIYGTSNNAPTGYHPRLNSSARNLGFVADPAKDGWTVGTPTYYGDFFYPGTPQEGFAVQFNGNTYRNWNIGFFNIPGSNLSHVVDATGVTSIWEGTVSGLKVNQKTFAPLNEVFFVVRIELTNTTGADMTDVYYMRTLDPDNDVTLSSNYSTINEIVYDLPNPQNNTLVSATGTMYSGSYLGLGTKDCRANSFILSGGLSPDSFTPINTIHSQSASGMIYTGTYTNDVGIGITYNLGTIPAGQTKRIAFTYILNESDLDVALSQTLPEAFANTTTPIISGSSYTFCEGETINMTINNGEDQVWQWSPAEYFSAPFGENVTLTVPNTPVNFTINGVSDCNPVVYNFTISPSAFQANLEEEYHVLCSGSSTSHNPMDGVTSPTSTINWYDAPTGGTLLSSSYTFSTPVLTNASSTPIEYLYYFQETTASGCVSERIPFRIKVYNTLNIPDSQLKVCTFGVPLTPFNLLDYQNIVEPIDNATFTYYASLSDLANNIPISNPANYTNTSNNQIIYVKIEVNSSCSDVAELTLQVFEQIAVTPTQLNGCDDDFDNIAEFDLTQANNSINTNADSQFSYYLTLANAQDDINEITNFTNYTNIVDPQTIYVKVSNPNCENITQIILDVFDKPILSNGTLNSCEENIDGTANFDLTSAQSQFSSDTSITYNYATSLSDLQNGILISNTTNYTNTSNPQVIFVEGSNSFGCSNIVELTLNIQPVTRYTISDFNKCDDNFDGFVDFNLSDKVAEMNAILPAGTYTFTYHTSEFNALNGISPLPVNYTNTITPDEIIWVKAQPTSGCPKLINFKLHVLAQAVLTNGSLSSCEENLGGTANFDLTAAQSQFSSDATLNFNYATSLSNLQNNILITNTTNFTNTSNPQIIYVAGYNANNCSNVIELTLNVLTVNRYSTTDFRKCDDDFDGFVNFNLNDKNSEINSLLPTDTYSFTYHATELDALNGINTIASNYTNTISPEQIIWVRAIGTSGCQKLISIKLIVSPRPVLTNSVLNNCKENLDGTANFNFIEAQPSFSSDNTLTYNYATSALNLANGIYITNITNFTNTSNPQTIYAEATTVFGCKSLVELTINVLPVNSYTISDFNKCDDDFDGFVLFDLTEKEAEMNTILPSDTYTYTYYLSEIDALNDTNAISSSFTNTLVPEQTIFVRAQGTGCPHIISFKLIVLIKPYLVMTPIRGLCVGDTIVLNAGNGFDSYLWSTGETSQSIYVNTPGTYTITVENFYGTFSCSTTQTIQVVASDIAIINDVEVVDFTNNDNSLTIIYEGIGDHYEFSINGIDYQDSPVFENLESGIYTVYVKDKYGCGIVDTEVYVLMYPNYFTPNGDGINDYWNIKFSSKEPEMTVSIFDRYGKLIKVLTGTSYGWDGTYNGEQMPSTDYWFLVNRKDGKEFRGHFSLKR